MRSGGWALFYDSFLVEVLGRLCAGVPSFPQRADAQKKIENNKRKKNSIVGAKLRF